MAAGPNLDLAILATTPSQFRKVASVIADVAKALGRTDDEFCNEIAARIRALAKNGHLESTGDLSDWRSSEIRLPRAQDAGDTN